MKKQPGNRPLCCHQQHLAADTSFFHFPLPTSSLMQLLIFLQPGESWALRPSLSAASEQRSAPSFSITEFNLKRLIVPQRWKACRKVTFSSNSGFWEPWCCIVNRCRDEWKRNPKNISWTNKDIQDFPGSCAWWTLLCYITAAGTTYVQLLSRNSSVNGEDTHTPPGGIDLFEWVPCTPLSFSSYRERHDAILCAPPAVPSTMKGH